MSASLLYSDFQPDCQPREDRVRICLIQKLARGLTIILRDGVPARRGGTRDAIDRYIGADV